MTDQCVYGKLLQSCPVLYHPTYCSPPGSSAHGDSPGKNSRVGCHALFQRIFLTLDQTCVSQVSCIGRWLLYLQSIWEARPLTVDLTSGAASYKDSSHHRCDLFSMSWPSFLFGELILRCVSFHGCKMPASAFQGPLLLASSLAEKSQFLFLAFPENFSDLGALGHVLLPQKQWLCEEGWGLSLAQAWVVYSTHEGLGRLRQD